MAYHSTASNDYISQINNTKKPTYSSKYNDLLSSKLNEIINAKDFTYDAESDPVYQQYKNEYVTLGKDVVQNAVNNASNLAGGYGNSYSAAAASQANQQYITGMSERIPQLMDAAMKKYQMEQENAYRQFGALQSEESRQYGQYRDTVSDYYSDVNYLTEGYKQALDQENNVRNYEYQKTRDDVSDAQWRAEFDYKKSRDDKEDENWKDELAYQMLRDAQSDNQWQKEFDLKNMEYENALKKAKSSGSSRRSSSSNQSSGNNSFFKMQGTANTKSSDVNTVDTSRNATLSVTRSRTFINNLLGTASDSEAQYMLNSWAEDGYISEGDYDYLVDLYNKLKANKISSISNKKVSNKSK